MNDLTCFGEGEILGLKQDFPEENTKQKHDQEADDSIVDFEAEMKSNVGAGIARNGIVYCHGLI